MRHFTVIPKKSKIFNRTFGYMVIDRRGVRVGEIIKNKEEAEEFCKKQEKAYAQWHWEVTLKRNGTNPCM